MLKKTLGIVLHTVAYNDKNHIAHLYTEKYGRMSYAIPQTQGRKSKSQRPLFTPFSILDIESDYKPGRDIQKIKEVRPAEILQQIHYDPVKNSIALFLSEFLSRTIREPEANSVFFEFLHQSIKFLDFIEDGKANFHLCFLIRISGFLGFYPNIENYRPGDYFDLLNGISTSVHPGHAYVLSPDETSYFTTLMRMNYYNLHLFRFSRQERIQILEHIIENYIMPDSHNSNLLTYSKHYSTNYTTHLAKSRNNYTFVAANAFVVQWIEQKFPKL